MNAPLLKPGTHAARILAELRNYPDGASDSQLARILVTRHEIVNSNCRMMEAQGLISRERQHGVILNRVLGHTNSAMAGMASSGGIQDVATLSPGVTAPLIDTFPDDAPVHESDELSLTQSGERPWFWEGNVQATVVAFLREKGWTILHAANTGTREPSKDIEAARSGAALWVTVKGLPVVHPSAQARVWFADAMLDVIRYRQEDAAVSIGVALPESHLFQRWRERTIWLQRAAPFDYLWVGADGAVRFDPGRPSIL